LTKTARAASSADGHSPRVSDQLGGLIDPDNTRTPSRNQRPQNTAGADPQRPDDPGSAKLRRIIVCYGTERAEIIGRNADGPWDAIRSGARMRYEPLPDSVAHRLLHKPARKPRKHMRRRLPLTSLRGAT
jgi:hypothetical protein